MRCACMDNHRLREICQGVLDLRLKPYDLQTTYVAMRDNSSVASLCESVQNKIST